jgi:hypothetical protein
MAALIVLAGASTEAQEPQWLTEVAKLTASDAAPGDEFGLIYAAGNLDGDTAIIGAWRDDHGGGIDAGSAYVFTRTSGTWSEQQKLVASDAAPGDRFGNFITVSGDTAFISAHLDDHSGLDDAGAVYVFMNSGGTWIQHQKLIASTPVEDDWFGWGVALDGDTLVVGSGNWGFSSEAGSAEVFIRSGNNWVFQQELTASDGEPNDVFGHFVAISGDTIVVSAPWDQHSSLFKAGSAYVFTRSGNTWAEQQKITPGDADANDEFGICVSISGDTVMIGSKYDDHNPGQGDSGSVYVFNRLGDTWFEHQEFTSSDAVGGDHFGDALTLKGDTAIISARLDDHSGYTDAGSLYVFVRSDVSWVEREKVVASDMADGDGLGWGIPVSGDTVFAGAALDDHSGYVDAGSVYVFKLALFVDGFESGDTSAWSNSVP